MSTRMRILIEGRLHAMNFRFNTQQEATALGLTGFVRTLSDGQIEIDASGEKADIEKLLTWCQEEPHGSQIKSILYRYEQSGSEHQSGFTVR